MTNIEKIKDDLYVKKGIGGWRIVHPIKNDDGSVNWKNLLIGDWVGFLKILFFLGIIAFLIFIYREDVQNCSEIISSPCVQRCYTNNFSDFELSDNLTIVDMNGVMNNDWENNERLP